MGRRSATETVAALFLAFLQQPTWQQAELARSLGVTAKTLRSCLTDLELAGLPLERVEEHPHVYLSVPAGWVPGAVAFSVEEARALARMLVRHAKTPDRDLVLARLVSCLSQRTASAPAKPSNTANSITTQVGAEAQLPFVQDATTRRCVLQIQYFSAHRGQIAWRDISPARLTIGPPARVLALCHRTGTLKWFRVSNIIAARLVEDTSYLEAPSARVDEVFSTSLNGYHDGEGSRLCRFTVRDPDARWLKSNLPDGAKVTDMAGGIIVEVDSGALLPLARLVVGLGDAASIETPALEKLVKHLARGALRVTRPPVKTTPLRSPRRSTLRVGRD